MNNSLPLKYKLLLAPAVIIVPVIFVIILMLYYLNVIGEQNDNVREWAHTTDQIRIAISSIQQLEKTIRQYPASSAAQNEEHIFNYIEQSRLLEGSINNPVLKDKVNAKTLDNLKSKVDKIRYKENIDITSVTFILSALTPQLEQIYAGLQAQKRSIYIDSNEYIKSKTSALASVTISVLGLCAVLGIILSLWISRSTISRIKEIAKNANLVCDNNSAHQTTVKNYDDLEDLAICLSMISSQMLNSLAAEKLLSGVDNERKRIAMDIHDQFLSDLNIFKRNLNQTLDSEIDKDELSKINNSFDDLAVSLRGIIDDLHPQTLEMFGLNAALQSYMQRKLLDSGPPDYYINIDSAAEARLNLFQKLTIYRILLESIQNIIRHANASRYEIDLRLTNDQLLLTVEDNGTGFDINSVKEAKGHGIFNITQRAYAMHAQVKWNKSRFSSGTQLLISLPLIYLKDTPDTKQVIRDEKFVPTT